MLPRAASHHQKSLAKNKRLTPKKTRIVVMNIEEKKALLKIAFEANHGVGIIKQWLI